MLVEATLGRLIRRLLYTILGTCRVCRDVIAHAGHHIRVLVMTPADLATVMSRASLPLDAQLRLSSLILLSSCLLLLHLIVP